MTDFNLTDEVREDAKSAWYRYLELVMPFRPDLYRYCRGLTGHLWDGEDLVQDTLVRGFATLGSIHHRIDNPRAYLVRIATNLWIDAERRRRSERSALLVESRETKATPTASPSRAVEMRDAAAALMERLAPQERAAVLLKDVFDMDLKETANILRTTVGAVKAALHRGRARLRESASETSGLSGGARVSRDLVDRFVDRYNARDLSGLLALMLETASIDLLGLDVETGRESFGREGGWFHHNLYGQDWAAERPSPARWESAVFRGEVVALVFAPSFEGREVLGSVMRFEEDEGKIASIRAYALCPETVREVGEDLAVPIDADPYRFISMILAFARGQ